NLGVLPGKLAEGYLLYLIEIKHLRNSDHCEEIIAHILEPADEITWQRISLTLAHCFLTNPHLLEWYQNIAQNPDVIGVTTCASCIPKTAQELYEEGCLKGSLEEVFPWYVLAEATAVIKNPYVKKKQKTKMIKELFH
ncbi:MAG: hypothetical protein M1514_02190, partial [Patescibacteria group bacterium]|nr:hypothetical protein [Patescibacteria group bacterium]